MATWAIRTGLAGLVFLSSMSAKADSGGCVSVISAGVPIFGVSSVVSESGPVPSANPAKPPQPAIPPDSVQPSAEREVIAEARLEHKYVQDVIHNRCSEAARDLRQVEHPTHRFVEELTAELGARSPMTVAGTRMILNNLRFPLADHPYLSNAVVWLAGSQDPAIRRRAAQLSAENHLYPDPPDSNEQPNDPPAGPAGCVSQAFSG